jgi:hypothetical protein
MERHVQSGLRTTTDTDDLTAPADTGTTTNPGTIWQRGQTNGHAHTPEDPSSATADAQPQIIGGSRLI